MFDYPALRNSGLTGFRKELDRLFDDFWANPSLVSAHELSADWAPSAEIEEEDDHFLLTLEIPGMRKEDLHIEAHDSQVTISGERKAEEKKRHYSERRFGRFFRSFSLPSGLDAGKIEAQYEDGVLKVYVPKMETAKPKQITVGDGKPGGVFSRLLEKKKEKGPKDSGRVA